MKKPAPTRAAEAAFNRNRDEALRRLALITSAVKKMGKNDRLDWGHVGSMAAVVDYLGHAGHCALVPELTEQ